MPTIEIKISENRTRMVYVTQEQYDDMEKRGEIVSDAASDKVNRTGDSLWRHGRPSLGAAVHPEQIQAASEYDKKKGIPTHYTKSGEPIFESAGHKKKWLRAHNMHDKQDYTR